MRRLPWWSGPEIFVCFENVIVCEDRKTTRWRRNRVKEIVGFTINCKVKKSDLITATQNYKTFEFPFMELII